MQNEEFQRAKALWKLPATAMQTATNLPPLGYFTLTARV